MLQLTNKILQIKRGLWYLVGNCTQRYGSVCVRERNKEFIPESINMDLRVYFQGENKFLTLSVEIKISDISVRITTTNKHTHTHTPNQHIHALHLKSHSLIPSL